MTDTPPKILYLEDDEPLANLIRRRLLREGCAVELAGTGPQGVGKATATAFDAVVVDFHLPGCDGLDVLRQLQQLPVPPPVVMVSGVAGLEVAVQALRLGAADYVVKESGGNYPELLCSTLRQVVEKQQLLRQRQQSEAALRASEARFRAVTHSAVDAIISADHRGDILFWNNGARLIFGYREEEILGQSLVRIIPQRLRAAHRQGLDRIYKTGEPHLAGQVVALSGLHRDGHEIPLEVSLGSWTIAGEWFFSAVIRDVTEHKKMEQALRRAKEAAEQASQAKSEFLATMSHEIRTPMSGILGMAELLVNTAEIGGKARFYAETIHRSGEALLEIINDILDFSKIEAGRLELESTSFDPHRLLAEVSALFRDYAWKKGVAFQLRIDPNLPKALLGDPTRIRQILVNLLSNAIKFTETGKIVLHTEWRVNDSQNGWLRSQVQDTGIGISAQQFAKIFKSFEQADTRTTRKYGGTGLGLTITHRLVKLMKGDIEVESTLGVGSTFRIEIPLAIGYGVFNETSDSVAQAKDADVPRNARLLLVEDDEVNRMVAKGMLKRWNLVPDLAENGVQALKCLSEKSYDLVFMDCQMPGMDGYTACRAFREMEDDRCQSTRTPVVALTACVIKGDRERCMAAGMDDYLAKPMRLRDLKSVLLRWLAPDKGPVQSSRVQGGPADDPAGDPVLDPGALRGLIEEVDENIALFVNMFLDGLPERLQAIVLSVADREPENLERSAHSLKGASRQFGVMRVADLAAKLEILGRSGTVEGAEEVLIPRLKTALLAAEEALRAAMEMPGK